MIGFFRIVLPIVGVVLVGIGVAALVVGSPRVAPGWEESEGWAIEKETEPASQAERPLMDVAAPSQTETATFALG